MTFWLVAVLLASAAAAALLYPMLRRRPEPRDPADYDLEVYRDQLGQIERDRADGLIGEPEAEASRAEIGRRLLAADGRRKAGAARPSARPAWGAALAVAILVPVSAFLLYGDLGMPGLPDFPHGAQSAPGDRTADLRALAEQLTSRLETEPTEIRGWMLLGRTYSQLEEHDNAAAVYEKALILDGGNTELRSAYGEALVLAGKGVVSAEAREAFEAVLRKQPKEPRALFYLAVADEQAGRLNEALARWSALIEASPPDAPWIGIARERAGRTAEALGLDPDKAVPPAKGPTEGDVAAAQSMTPEDRRAMIEGMVQQLADRLEQQPDDLDGWLRLGRSYTVLERHADARDALARAAALAPDNKDVLLLQGRAIRAAAGDRETPESLAAMRRVIALDPGNIEALWLVGLSEIEAGERAAGLAKMQQALDRIPADAPNRDALVRRLEELRAGKR